MDDPAFDARDVLGQHILAVEQRQAQQELLLERLRALQAAAEVSWAEVAEVIALTERLNHPDHNTRIRATLDVRRGEDAATLPVLLERLKTEPDFFVLENLTWAAVQMGEPTLPLIQAHLNHPELSVKDQSSNTWRRKGGAPDMGVPDPSGEARRETDGSTARR
ncbi:hypothetical protein ACFFLM_26060 [Deinococcus oregonensis]|uniref:HEAT repeat domain-containing protein n=1 Tax=Deinococcus oregonensis TaxID=1805970 RepID=A0ABV6B6U4_9DEIO